MTRRRDIVPIAAGFTLLAAVAAPVARPDAAPVTTITQVPMTAPPAATTPSTTPTASVAPGTTAPPTTTAAPTATSSPVGVPPATVSFPSGATAPIRPVGVLPSGDLQLPDDPSMAGWWAGGAGVGSAGGSIVVAGHLDSRRYGIGTFATLHELEVGDVVELVDQLGRLQRYLVTEWHQSAKADLDAALLATDGPHRLVLVTCGGAFDADSRHYTDNVIVVAVPTDAA